MSSHSYIAPSSAHVWLHCAGAPMMAMLTDDGSETDEAREGTATHWVGFECLQHGRSPADFLGVIAPNSVKVDDGMVESAAHYVEYVRSIPGVSRHLEQRVHASSLHPELWGSCDCWTIDHTTHTLHVADFKHGHRIVEVFENWQLICYAAGVLEQLQIDGIADQLLRVVFHVVQPRAAHPDGIKRRWSVQASDLRGYFNRISASAHGAYDPAAKCVSGTWCADCNGRLGCDAGRRAGFSIMQYTADPIPLQLNADQVGTELLLVTEAMEALKGRRTALEQRAQQYLRSGQNVPNHALRPKQGRETWQLDPDAVFAFGDAMGVELRKPQEPITPTQAVAAGLDRAIIDSANMTTRPDRGVELVKDDGQRARRAFGA
jgi:hypothetical protein